MRPVTRIGRVDPVEQSAVDVCGEISEYGEVCAEPSGHVGMHMTIPDSGGCVTGWPQDRLRLVLG